MSVTSIPAGQEPPFDLEIQKPGEIPPAVIEELRRCRTIALDYAQAYADAIKAAGEKHGVKAGALKRYINALVADKVEDLSAETDDLERLLEK